MPVAVCADNTDFQLDEGQLRLNPHHAETDQHTFVHVVGNTFEEITELGDVTIPVDGVWVVTFDARGLVEITPVNPPTDVQAGVSAALYVDDVFVPNTETRLAYLGQDDPTTAQPRLQQQGTGSCTRVLELLAGQVLSLYGKRDSLPGTSSQILSDANGRCRITAHRIGGL